MSQVFDYYVQAEYLKKTWSWQLNLEYTSSTMWVLVFFLGYSVNQTYAFYVNEYKPLIFIWQVLNEALNNPEQAAFINEDVLQEYRGSGGVRFYSSYTLVRLDNF
jgi:hypothetical protein